MTNKIKIALVDDEHLFLEGLSGLFKSNKKVSIVLTSTDGHTFMKELYRLSDSLFPEIIIVDICMQPMDGFELVEHLKNKHPNLKIIVLSSHYRAAMLGHMIKLGISAFLPKNATQKLLFEAIENVYNTGVFFTNNDHEMLSQYVKSKSQNIYFHSKDDLSKREIEVLQLICAENTNQEIANKLFISKRTVESHRLRLQEKIGTKNTVGLVVYAICNEIYCPDLKFYN